MKKIIICLILILSIYGIYAGQFTPQGNINMRGVYSIYNTTNISANYFLGSFIGNIVGDVISNNINNITYIFNTDTTTEIQTKLNNAGSIIFTVGNYALNTSLSLSSNTDILIEKGVLIYWNTGAITYNVTDVQNDTTNWMIYGINIENVSINNLGSINPTYIFNPSNSELAFIFNNSNFINIDGGKYYNSQIAFFNGDNYSISNLYLNSANVYTECSNNGIIQNIIGSNKEAIDLNGYDKNIIINNIVFEGNFTDDEIIDVNAGENILITNIYARNANKLLTASNISGIRHGTCTPFVGNNIKSYNLNCDNCNNKAALSAENSTLMYEKETVEIFIESNHPTNRILEINHQTTTGRGFFIQGDSLTSGYNFFSYSNSGDATGTLNLFQQDNVGATGDVVQINNDGTGDSLQINTNDLIVDDEGNVGIGVTTPSENLEVNANIKAAEFIGTLNWSYLQNYPSACPANSYLTQLDDSVTCTGISDVYLSNSGDTATGNYNFDSNTFFIDSSNNKVGINTNAPSALLSIDVGASGGTGINIRNSNDLITSRIEVDSNGHGLMVIEDNTSVNKILFKASGNSYFKGGSLSVATESTSGKLTVLSDAESQRGIYVSRNIASSADGLVTIFSDNGADTGNTLFIRNDGSGAGVKFQTNSGPPILMNPQSTATCSGTYEGAIYYDSDDNHFYGCNATAWIQLDN